MRGYINEFGVCWTSLKPRWFRRYFLSVSCSMSLRANIVTRDLVGYVPIGGEDNSTNLMNVKNGEPPIVK